MSWIIVVILGVAVVILASMLHLHWRPTLLHRRIEFYREKLSHLPLKDDFHYWLILAKGESSVQISPGEVVDPNKDGTDGIAIRLAALDLLQEEAIGSLRFQVDPKRLMNVWLDICKLEGKLCGMIFLANAYGIRRFNNSAYLLADKLIGLASEIPSWLSVGEVLTIHAWSIANDAVITPEELSSNLTERSKELLYRNTLPDNLDHLRSYDPSDMVGVAFTNYSPLWSEAKQWIKTKEISRDLIANLGMRLESIFPNQGPNHVLGLITSDIVGHDFTDPVLGKFLDMCLEGRYPFTRSALQRGEKRGEEFVLKLCLAWVCDSVLRGKADEALCVSCANTLLDLDEKIGQLPRFRQLITESLVEVLNTVSTTTGIWNGEVGQRLLDWALCRTKEAADHRTEATSKPEDALRLITFIGWYPRHDLLHQPGARIAADLAEHLRGMVDKFPNLPNKHPGPYSNAVRAVRELAQRSFDQLTDLASTTPEEDPGKTAEPSATQSGS